MAAGEHAEVHRGRLSEALVTVPCVGLALVLTALFATFVPGVAAGERYRFAYTWIPNLDVSFSFYIDGLSLTFALLISFIGALITLYTGAYAAHYRYLERLQIYLVLFMLSMLGLVLADNLITLFVFWELTTITSYLLIGIDHDSPSARRSALQALLVTVAGGLALLAGFVLLGFAGGSFELSALRVTAANLPAHPHYTAILILVLLGAFTKSAQFPFHFWLPNAMAAPTPVSAYLHSATMVKGGVYLLARLHPILGGTDAWLWSLTVFGAITAVLGSLLALRQTDLKLMLAYTTVMALGTLTMFLGSDASVATAAAMTFLIVHAFYKCALFLVVGIVDHGTGTRELPRVGGLGGAMPITAVAACVAGLSMAGIPPFLGFIGKELQYEASLVFGAPTLLVVLAALAANAMMVAVAGLVTLKVFFGPRQRTPATPHEGPPRMWLGPVLLATFGLLFGLWAAPIAEMAVQPGVLAIQNRPVPIALYLWHGINLPLMLSVVTIGAGAALYVRHDLFLRYWALATRRLRFTADRGYDLTMEGLGWVARVQTAALQSGSFTYYVAVTFAVFGVSVGATLILKDGLVAPAGWPQIAFYEWAVVVLIAAAAVITIVTNSRLAAICALGVLGAGVALVFLFYGAPDVAMTQLLVETLFVVIIAVALLRLPVLPPEPTSRGRRLRDAGLALIAGASTTALILGATAAPFDRTVTDYYEAVSYVEAHGRNIVNVILVDFRALDTLGEITVLAGAALAAIALIRGVPLAGSGSRAWGAVGVQSLILFTATRLLVSLMLLFSVFLLLRGHNEPGGGFLGGLIAATAFVLYSIADSPAAVRRTLRVDPRVIAAAGLGFAVLAGLLAALAGVPFLTGLWGEAGDLHVGTPLIFDVGVYLVVVGSVLTVVLALEKES